MSFLICLFLLLEMDARKEEFDHSYISDNQLNKMQYM
jgi:hypothetical protein